jgi:hypothetical protein
LFNACFGAHSALGVSLLVELNLSGRSVDKLPDGMEQYVPKLKKLILDDCVELSCLPVSLGLLMSLEHVSVKGCTSLVHPPKSQQHPPSKLAAFLRQLHHDSATWRRLKVQLPLYLA